MNKRTLLPPNASKQERGIELSIARDIPVNINPLWNADTCPLALLPWLAWALSVDEWDDDWTDAQKRQTIKQSATLHLKKGTKGAVKRALETVGVKIELSEWFESDDNTTPHTFEITSWANCNLTPASRSVLSPELYRTLRRLLDTVKPVRSHYFIRVGAAFDDALGMGNVMSAIQSVRCDAKAQQEPINAMNGITSAAMLQTTEITRNYMIPTIEKTRFNNKITLASISQSAILAQSLMVAA